MFTCHPSSSWTLPLCVPRLSPICQMSVVPGQRVLPCWVACKPNSNTHSCSQMERGRRDLERRSVSQSRSPQRLSRIIVSPLWLSSQPTWLNSSSEWQLFGPFHLWVGDSTVPGACLVIGCWTLGWCHKTAVIVSLSCWWAAWCVYMAQMVRDGKEGGTLVPAWKVIKTSLIKWCHMRALMCHCDRTFLFI